MYGFILFIHVVVCLILIAVILLQAGRGGGLAGLFGGGGAESVLGTRANTFMTKATGACAAIFILTSMSLAILSAHRGKSLMAGQTPPAVSEPAGTPAPELPQSKEATTTTKPEPAQVEPVPEPQEN